MFSLTKDHLRRQFRRPQSGHHHQVVNEVLPRLFEHELLNLNSSSLRLIQVCPALSSDERVRCRLKIASTDSQYICLSYVWGEESTSDWIYINDERFAVRRNLLDFLRSARQVPELTAQWLWIDALCIDQTNTPERQHQVQQMGRVYEGAKEVISWLGTDQDIIALFRDRPGDGRNANGLVALSKSSYWWRAWVIQEIILGPYVRLMADIYMLPLDELPPYHTAMAKRWIHYGAIQTRVLHMRKLLQARKTSDVTLISLLHHFQDQLCRIQRDKIFSLLGLCKNGSDLEVDYSIPDHSLALKVLEHCRDSFCICAAHTVSDALKLQYDHLSQMPSTSLILPILPENSKESRNQEDRVYRENSDCIRHRGSNCQENNLHGIELYEPEFSWRSRMIISINLRYICSMYCDEFVIEVHPTYCWTRYRYSDQSIEEVWNSWDDPSSIVVQLLDHGQACRVEFSLNFWFWIACVSQKFRQSELNALQDRCCSRVTRPGERRPEDSGVQLTNDSEHQGGDGYFSLPQDVDRFVHSVSWKRFRNGLRK